MNEHDAEIERILAMTEAELVAEAAAEGRDIALEADEMRALVALIIEKHRTTQEFKS